MATITISLPDLLKSFAEDQAAREGFGSVSEYLEAKLREAQVREAKKDLEAKLREGIESGPAVPMTREEWDELERCVWERERVSPDVR